MGNERKIHWRSWDFLSKPKKDGGMGFRDLRSFNLAMLAKQGWRLIQDQDSLLFQCLKARYFPRCNFLDAAVSPNCSYTWRSILAAMPILKSGCCWRVGDGLNIRGAEDKWIPNHPTNKILFPTVMEDENWCVADLIDQDLYWWNRDLIYAKFHKVDADAICKIPLSVGLHRMPFFGCIARMGHTHVSQGIKLQDRLQGSWIGLNAPRVQQEDKYGRRSGS